MKELVDLKGFEGLYQINNNGDVYSLPKKWILGMGGAMSHNGKILKKSIHKSGYITYGLRKDGKHHKIYGHRLVAESFLINSGNKKEVNHKNGIKTDNRVENLEWVTSKENARHAQKTGLNNKDYLKKKVIDNHSGLIFSSVKDAANYKNISPSQLSNMLNNRENNYTQMVFV